ncbi:hypothetical protein SAMN04488024_10240 [Pedobacter soli]|uniref:Uncharacterized protein n=2 Tax=Pedobacter soli TaxID=390242 RepID=A0A1G6LIR7_9SPHI|nr:hypothetical protein SAMN04488024_10240 [Pedobacter soli]
MLPFECGTQQLTRSTLHSHSEFRKPRRTYLYVATRLISILNNILTFSVNIENENEEKVYLKVTQTHLLVSCSVDTDKTYLSRYAYFLLDKYLNFYPAKDMDNFYWPDFFDATGKSKFLEIENKGNTFEIKLRTKYQFFYKPGLALPLISGKYWVRRSEVQGCSVASKHKNQTEVTAYCVLDPLSLHIQNQDNKELTLLIPIKITLNKDQRSFKSMLRYMNPSNSYELTVEDDDQYLLNNICKEMWKNTLFFQNKNAKTGILSKKYIERNLTQFKLWEQAFPLVSGQKFVYYQPIYGLRYIKGKPTKKDISSCEFSPEIPTLKFFLKDKGDYYTLEIKFSVNEKIFNFASHLTTHYFAASDIDPKRFYLLGSPEDAELVSFFARINFSLPVLKKHYHSHFKVFTDKIRRLYGIKNDKLKLPA